MQKSRETWAAEEKKQNRQQKNVMQRAAQHLARFVAVASNYYPEQDAALRAA
jgi:pyruvate/2-oxoacid:ferredoxin oxidoreductase beta subunit